MSDKMAPKDADFCSERKRQGVLPWECLSATSQEAIGDALSQTFPQEPLPGKMLWPHFLAHIEKYTDPALCGQGGQVGALAQREIMQSAERDPAFAASVARFEDIKGAGWALIEAGGLDPDIEAAWLDLPLSLVPEPATRIF